MNQPARNRHESKLTIRATTVDGPLPLLEDRPPESRRVADGVVIDYDSDRAVTGIEIEHARDRLDLSRLILAGFPGDTERTTA
jgi:hypothetical protein